MAQHSIQDWTVVQNDEGITVREVGGSGVTSNTLKERVSARVVKDVDGATFVLGGHLRTDVASGCSTSQSLLKKFVDADGVPAQWRAVVRDALREEALKVRLRKLDWRDLNVIGIEVMGLEELYNEAFAFPNIAREFERGGVLYGKPYPLYCFMGAQPIYLNGTVRNVPYIVFIDSEVPPPAVLANHSIQKEREQLIPMEQLSMGWTPYVPPKAHLSEVEGVPYQIFALNWYRRPDQFRSLTTLKTLKELTTQFAHDRDERHALLERAEQLVRELYSSHVHIGNAYLVFMRKIMRKGDPDNIRRELERLDDEIDQRPLEELHKWEYLVPFFESPSRMPDGPKEVTVVDFEYAVGEKRTKCMFDKTIDKFAVFVPDLLDELGVQGDAERVAETDRIKERVKAEFQKKRAAMAAEYESAVQRLNAYTDEQRRKLDEARFYKFYPNHNELNVVPYIDPKINLYFGDAHQVFAPVDGFVVPEYVPPPPSTPARARSSTRVPGSLQRRARSRSRSRKRVARTPAKTASSTKSKTASSAKKRARSKSRTPAAKKRRT